MEHKLYPTLSPSAPEDEGVKSQVFRLRKIEEIKQYFRRKFKERDSLEKKFKMYGTWVRWSDHILLGVSVTITGCWVGALATGLDALLCIAMGGITLAMGVGQAGLKNIRTSRGSAAIRATGFCRFYKLQNYGLPPA